MTPFRAPVGLLCLARPVARRIISPSGVATQVRHKIIYKDGDLGGPGGQQPPPPRPGGPEAVKRNWVPVAGAALAAAAAYAYFTAPREAVDKARQADARGPGQTLGGLPAAVGEDAEQLGNKVGQQVAEQAGKTMKEMSGRQKTEQGSFRHD
ncbi:hypothetical protein NOR_05284 [Metarhizium rileyi]|uniref:Uncharacterized protein n=1 Tax=Metarhizium rileyi (strain RCEF 4871) TaxID=1649241 RepID=A0A167CZU5_METRR|nr:hypothetical protein NOR_05284 [Metarhizium rileyi RCEF 4871]